VIPRWEDGDKKVI